MFVLNRLIVIVVRSYAASAFCGMAVLAIDVSDFNSRNAVRSEFLDAVAIEWGTK
jgi:hypothetical protein